MEYLHSLTLNPFSFYLSPGPYKWSIGLIWVKKLLRLKGQRANYAEINVRNLNCATEENFNAETQSKLDVTYLRHW